MMVEVEETGIEKPFWSRRANWTIDTIASFFWLYAVTKLFIFDLDLWLMGELPTVFMLLIEYRLLVILCSVCLILILKGTPFTVSTVLYVAIFPIVLILWKVPRALWKRGSWPLALATMNTVVSIFSSLKRDLLLTTAFLIAVTVTLVANHRLALYASVALLITVLSFAYAYSIIRAFKPSAVFQAYKKIFPALHKTDFLKVDTSVTLLPADKMSGDQLTLTTNSLQNVVLYNRACLFLARRLRDYQKSRLNTLSQIIGLLFLLVFTAVIFSFVNYGIFKIDETSYRSEFGTPGFFTFFYYSTGCIFYATNGVEPANVAAQIAQIIQFFFSVLLLVILGAILFTMRGEKYSAELDEVVHSAEREGRNADSLIKSSFNVSSVDAAIEALQAAKAGLVGVILAATRSLDETD